MYFLCYRFLGFWEIREVIIHRRSIIQSSFTALKPSVPFPFSEPPHLRTPAAAAPRALRSRVAPQRGLAAACRWLPPARAGIYCPSLAPLLGSSRLSVTIGAPLDACATVWLSLHRLKNSRFWWLWLKLLETLWVSVAQGYVASISNQFGKYQEPNSWIVW